MYTYEMFSWNISLCNVVFQGSLLRMPTWRRKFVSERLGLFGGHQLIVPANLHRVQSYFAAFTIEMLQRYKYLYEVFNKYSRVWRH